MKKYENQGVFLSSYGYAETFEGGKRWDFYSPGDYEHYDYFYINKYGIMEVCSWGDTISEVEVTLDEHGNCTYYKGQDSGQNYQYIIEYFREYEYDDNGNIKKASVTVYSENGYTYTNEMEYTYTNIDDMVFEG